MKGFSKLWISGTTSVHKDSSEKHFKGSPYLHAADLEKKQKFGADTSNQEMVSSLPIGWGVARWLKRVKKL